MLYVVHEWWQAAVNVCGWCDRLDTWLIRRCPPFARWRRRMSAEYLRRFADFLRSQ